MLILSVQIFTRGTALRMADGNDDISVQPTLQHQWFKATNFLRSYLADRAPQEEPPVTTCPAFCSSMAAFITLNKPHNRGQVAPTSGEQSNEDSDWMTLGIYLPMKILNKCL